MDGLYSMLTKIFNVFKSSNSDFLKKSQDCFSLSNIIEKLKKLLCVYIYLYYINI